MKTHLAWIRFATAAAIAALGIDAQLACGQYAPYGTTPYPATPQYSTTAPQPPAVAPYGVPQSQAKPYQPSAPVAYQQPGQQPGAYQQAPAQQPYTARGSQFPQQQPYPQTAYPQQASRPMYTASAQNGGGEPNGTLAPKGPTQAESLPMPEGGMNGNMQGSASMASPYPNTGAYGDANGSCGCNNNYGSCSTCNQDYGISNYFDGCEGGTVWFGGVYWLFMTRNDSSFQRLAVQVDDSSATYPYYPPARTTVLTTEDANFDYRNGAEIRFGSTFGGGGGCDSGDSCGYGYGGSGGCGGCQSCAQPTCGWEVAYWALDDDQNVARTTTDLGPADNFRYYSMKNFAGVEYDRDGAGATYGYRPVNVYYDYSVPVQAPTPPAAGDIRVAYQTVRSNFQCQNLELNFLKLPLFCGCTSAPSCGGCDSGACGYGGACGGGCGGYSAGGGCDSGCSSCNTCSCAPAFTLTGLCGVRYFKVDDDFSFRNTFQEYDGAAWGNNDNLTYGVNVDNNLLGFQTGALMNYNVACKWNVFLDSDFGIYGNDMEVRQRVFGNGNARFVNTGDNAIVSSNKDGVAFLGELRAGAGYDLTCHCRLVAAYRVVALTGVALSTEQIPENFASEGQVGRINNDGSLIVHGVQVGVECRY